PIGVIFTFWAPAWAAARSNASVAPACTAFMPFLLWWDDDTRRSMPRRAPLHRRRVVRALRGVAHPRVPPHVAGPDAAHALQRAAERGLGLVAEALGDLRHRRAARLEHLVGEVHAPGGEVLHRRAVEPRRE